MDSSNNSKHICCYCEKKFTRKDNMNKHIRVVHKQEPVMSKHTLKCPGYNCNQICHSMKVLRHHISSQHNVFLETEEFTFSTFEGNLRFFPLLLILIKNLSYFWLNFCSIMYFFPCRIQAMERTYGERRILLLYSTQICCYQVIWRKNCTLHVSQIRLFPQSFK